MKPSENSRIGFPDYDELVEHFGENEVRRGYTDSDGHQSGFLISGNRREVVKITLDGKETAEELRELIDFALETDVMTVSGYFVWVYKADKDTPGNWLKHVYCSVAVRTLWRRYHATYGGGYHSPK